MKLLIDPQGGMAGDMFSAALISAGADVARIREAMEAAGETLGTARIENQTTADGSSQLLIQLDSKRHHLGGNEAKTLLTKLFATFDIREKYRNLGMKILETLLKAEIRAHKEFDIVIEGDHTHEHDRPHNHPHSHSHDHSHEHSHEHSHDAEHNGHSHSSPQKEEAFLHEAQDIVIDIMGAVTGMQLLEIEPEAVLTAPVSVGGGYVDCSHGRLSIPAPATTIILEQYGLDWEKGPGEYELLTPTGAAILAALGSKTKPGALENLDVKTTGKARGTKILNIPPLQMFLV